MTYKQIEAAREVRLWIGQIIVPACVTVTTLMAIPEVRDAVAMKAEQVKWRVQSKFKKGEKV